MSARSSSRRADWFALLAYLLLTLVLTYPLLLNFTTHVAGDGSDDPALAWNLWWVPYALLQLGSSPIYTHYMFYPIGLNLGFYTLTYLNAFLAIPFQFAFGLIPAANVNLILSFTLSGFGAYLLTKYLLCTRGMRAGERARAVPPVAFAAGLVYAFSANKFLYASLGQFNIASSQWIPFYLLFLLKIFDAPKPPLKYGFLLGLFLLAQALSEFIFASFLVLFTVGYLAYKVVRTRLRIENPKSKIINLLVAALVVLVPMLPILAAMLADTLSEGDFIQQGLGFANSFSADLLGFFVPSHLHPLFGALEGQFHFAYINFMYVGFAALLLALLALWKVKPARSWGLAAFVIFLLTLGPTLRLNGAEWDLPLPFDLLLDLPLIKGNRYPSRWSVMLTLCLAVLVGYGLMWLVGRLEERLKVRRLEGLKVNSQPSNFLTLKPSNLVTPAALAVFGVLFCFESLSIPLPLSDLRVPSVYAQIAQTPGAWTVMEIPLAWRNGFRVTGSYRRDSQALPDAVFMLAQWYQTTQQHPILNGNTSRNPELKFQYFAETPVLNSLVAIQTGHTLDDATIARDKELAPRVLQFFGTRYVVWHTPTQDENRDVAQRTRAYIEQVLPVSKQSETYENGRGTVAYQINAVSDDAALTITPDAPLARLYLGEGWGALKGDSFWAERREAKLFLPVDTPRDFRLTLARLGALPLAGQGLTVRVNGTALEHHNPIPLENGAFSTVIPAALVSPGVNEIVLEFDRAVPLKDSTLAQTQKTGLLSLLVRSAGEEQGSFGHIYVNGVDESPNARGYNIVVVEPRTGKVQARANFDTFLSARESNRMVEFLEQVAEGDLVAVAASDDASAHLTQEGFDALRTIGARTNLRDKFRWSHAIIGVKGAPPGSASEDASETQVAQVSLNGVLSEPNVAASIGAIRFEPLK